jgi:hypothetical protein
VAVSRQLASPKNGASQRPDVLLPRTSATRVMSVAWPARTAFLGLVTQLVTQSRKAMTPVWLSWPLTWVGVPGLEPGTSSLSGCRRSGSDSGFAVVTWAYAPSARFGYLAMSCACTCGPRRSRATVGPTLGPGTFRSVGVGRSSRTVHRGLCTGPTFQSCPHETGPVQRLGSSIGSRRQKLRESQPH